MKLLFYDFEVFMFNWHITVIDPMNRIVTRMWDDPDQFTKFCDEHKSDIWIGCNNIHYDQYIKKSILLQMNPYEVSEFIIKKDRPGWMFSSLFRQTKFVEYDVMTRIDKGLKNWEGMMGNSIKETSVPFDIKRPLTEQEKKEVEEYCYSDVSNTIEVFMNKKNDFDAQLGLIKMFPEVLNIYDLSSTKAQISAKILECQTPMNPRDDEFSLFVLPCIQINKYKESIKWFLQFVGRSSKEADDIYKESFTMIIAGVEHKLAWGGIHAGKEKYKNLGHKEGRQIWHVDVASFYPRLMIFHNLLTRNSQKPEKFKQIYDKRIQLKHEGKKKEQAPLKIVINGTYGISKAETSAAYDPRNANLICMNGQLMLIDLIEHLESIKGFELIQSNTDGLIISLPDTDEAFEQMDDICAEWEDRCQMELEFDEIDEIHQKDVNNYVFRFANGKLERKGAYVKELNNLDYDLPIVNKAVVEFLMNGIPAERTILECDELKEFQMIKKASNKYSCIVHGGTVEKVMTNNHYDGTFDVKVNGGKILTEKTIRIFASKNESDGGLVKVHATTGRPAKIENTPEHSFIWNDSVNGVKCPEYLDKKWYINLANKRIGDFNGK